MKKIVLESSESGIYKIFKYFNDILDKANYNLNQFIKSDSLMLSSELPDEFLNSLKKFLDIALCEIKKIEEREFFWESFEKLDDYESNDRFIKWLMKYCDSYLRPYEEASFIMKMDDNTFQSITEYCFQNLIFKDIGINHIEKLNWDEKQMLIFRKIIFTFIEMIVVDNLSKENAFNKMEDTFGVKNSYCEKWYNLIIKNEDKLWKIMLSKKINRIENKLNRLLDLNP